MNLRKRENPRTSLNDTGWRAWRTSSLLPVAGEVFLLTLPFIERANRPVSRLCGRLNLEAPAGILGHKPIRQSSGCPCRLTEGLNGHGLVVHDVEDGIQPGNLHHIANLICEVEQLQFSLLLPHARESTDQIAQA